MTSIKNAQKRIERLEAEHAALDQQLVEAAEARQQAQAALPALQAQAVRKGTTKATSAAQDAEQAHQAAVIQHERLTAAQAQVAAELENAREVLEAAEAEAQERADREVMAQIVSLSAEMEAAFCEVEAKAKQIDELTGQLSKDAWKRLNTSGTKQLEARCEGVLRPYLRRTYGSRYADMTVKLPA